MLTSAREIIGFRVITQDGKAGRVRDMYIKDNIWAVRFFVAGTRRILPSFGILMNTSTVEWIDLHRKRVLTSLSRRGMRNCPKASSRITVSERRENAYIKTNMIHGPHMTPFIYGGMATPTTLEEPAIQTLPNELRSIKKVIGYRIHHEDGEFGLLDDFLIEDNFWILRYLVVKRPDGRRILVATDRVEIVSWLKQGLWVGMNRSDAAQAPEYNAEWLEQINKNERLEANSQ